MTELHIDDGTDRGFLRLQCMSCHEGYLAWNGDKEQVSDKFLYTLACDICKKTMTAVSFPAGEGQPQEPKKGSRE